ncbi:uncharacterized protein AAG666_011863 isoform 2-T8 [Megaptera novaeangliae]
MEGEKPRAAAEVADRAVPAEGLVEETKAATHVLRDGHFPENAQPRSDVKSFGSFYEALGRYGNQQASVLALAGRASIGVQGKHTEKVLISRTLLEDRPCKHKSFSEVWGIFKILLKNSFQY